MYNDEDDAYSAHQYTFINTHGTRCSKNKNTRFTADVARYMPPDEETLYGGNYPDLNPRRWVPFTRSKSQFVATRFSVTKSLGSRGSTHYDATLGLKAVEHWASIVAKLPK